MAKEVSPADIELPPTVEEQLLDLVMVIARTYQKNPFHNFKVGISDSKAGLPLMIQFFFLNFFLSCNSTACDTRDHVSNEAVGKHCCATEC